MLETDMLQADREMMRAIRHACGMISLSRRTLIEVTGQDRGKHLHNFCTADINRLQSGEGCEAFVLNAKGKTLGFVTVFCHEDSLWLESAAGQAEKLIAHLDRYVIREDVVFRDFSSDLRELLVCGPGAMKVMAGLGSSDLQLPLFAHRQHEIAGHGVTIARTDWTGEDEFLIVGDQQAMETVKRHLLTFDAVECDLAAFDVCRILAGTPVYGVDVTEDNLPQEIARNERSISFNKGCYLGQETVARLDAMGHVNKVFSKMVFDSVVPAAANTELWEITDGDAPKKAGTVSSVCLLPEQNMTVCLGFLKTAFAKPDTLIACGISGEHQPRGRVVGLYDKIADFDA